MKILVTGGMGYIGSHTVVDLLENDYELVIVDNLSQSSDKVLVGIEKITGKTPAFYHLDICDKNALETIFVQEKNIEGVVHFAAYKFVDESVSQPLKYYRNNIEGLLNMIEMAEKYNIKNFVFSSSCSVYGNIDTLPVSETSPMMPTQSPYATTKAMGEKIIDDIAKVVSTKFCSLRYFNPVGAHTSGYIGESPLTIPNNLVPRITAVAAGKVAMLKVFGKDYPTRDGTCIRDYIHVSDIAEAHTAALQFLEKNKEPHLHEIINIGSGEGVTVLELIGAFEKSTGVALNYELTDRREGDVIAVYSDSTKAKNLLGWEAKRTVDDMMITAWNWEQRGAMY